MAIFGPIRMQSLGGKSNCLVIVDDCTRYTWVFFLTHKHEVFSRFSKFAKKIQNKRGYSNSSIKIDHDGEYKNQSFQIFCEESGLEH